MTEEDNRTLPTSSLDLTMLTTNPVWGNSEVSSDLKQALFKYYETTNEQGDKEITAQSLWGFFSFYTRDIRLGNLSDRTGELKACRHYLELAGDLLLSGYIEPFIIALSRAISIVETSQSKNGFLRDGMNTITNKNLNQDLSPPKKDFFGGKQGG